MDVYVVEFVLLRPKNETQDANGRGFPGTFASVVRIQNAPLPRQEKSLELASAQGGLGFSDVAETMRRSSGPRGGRPVRMY